MSSQRSPPRSSSGHPPQLSTRWPARAIAAPTAAAPPPLSAPSRAHSPAATRPYRLPFHHRPPGMDCKFHAQSAEEPFPTPPRSVCAGASHLRQRQRGAPVSQGLPLCAQHSCCSAVRSLGVAPPRRWLARPRMLTKAMGASPGCLCTNLPRPATALFPPPRYALALQVLQGAGKGRDFSAS